MKKLEAGLSDASRFAAVLGVRVLPPVERPNVQIEKAEAQKEAIDEVDTGPKSSTPVKQFDERAIDVEWGPDNNSMGVPKSPNSNGTTPNTSSGGSATGNVKQRLAKGWLVSLIKI